MANFGIVSAREAARDHAELLAAAELALPDSLVYSNAARFDSRPGAAHRHGLFPARTAKLSAVELVWWPDGAMVFARDGFPAAVGDAWIDEQFPPWFRRDPARAAGMLAGRHAVETVDAECLLLARFGEGTWGHWLGELLPRAVLAEAAFPGRFRYAVPAWTTEPEAAGLCAAVLQSLRAYGISDDRLVRLHADCNYRFRALATVTSVRSDRAMHPGALDSMRSTVHVDPGAFGRYLPARVASLRTGIGRRGVVNAGVISRELARRGFLRVEFETMTFAAQVAVLRAAATICCVLGSGLAGVIYSPDHVQVIAPAPEDWGDNFFYPLVQARGGAFADLRGPIHTVDPVERRDSSFRIRPGELREALAAMGLEYG